MADARSARDRHFGSPTLSRRRGPLPLGARVDPPMPKRGEPSRTGLRESWKSRGCAPNPALRLLAGRIAGPRTDALPCRQHGTAAGMLRPGLRVQEPCRPASPRAPALLVANAGKCRHALRAQISVVAARSGEGWGWPQRWRRRGRLSVPHGCLASSPTVACPTETLSDTGQFEAERTRVGGWGRSEGRSAAGGTDASDSLSRSGGWWKAGGQSQARRRLPALVFRAARSSPVFASERAD
jgi:hypothetical protein